LHRIVLRKDFDKISNQVIPTFSPRVSFPQLRSLTIEELNATMKQLEALLSLTPSLVYLKLIGGERMIDGKRWEEFIQINLSQLQKFEFFFNVLYPTEKTLEDLELMVASFQTPFWIEHKKWFVNCDYKILYSTTIHLYSLPICKSIFTYDSEFKNLPLLSSNVMTPKQSTIIDNVKSVRLIMDKRTADHIQEKVCDLLTQLRAFKNFY
jgi:hypothetical protein